MSLLSSYSTTDSTTDSTTAIPTSSAFKSAKHALSITGHQINNVMTVFKKNKYVFATVLVLLIMYAQYAAPKLNKSLEGLLRNYFVKFVYIFVLAYFLTNSVNVAVVVSLVITIGALILKKLESENFDTGVSTQATKLINKVETTIDSLPPRTFNSGEATCADAKSVNVSSCQMQLERQNIMTEDICNENTQLKPVENPPSFNGYVQPANNQVDPNINISFIPSAANDNDQDHFSLYTTDNKGDQQQDPMDQHC